MEERTDIIVQEDNIRLDIYLTKELKDISRTFIQKLIKDKQVSINGAYSPTVHTRVKLGDKIEVTIPKAEELKVIPQNIRLKIIYEDKDIIVVDKQAGMVVHPAAGNYEGTLVNALLFHCRDLAGIAGSLRPGIVHRLDKDTSGVMVVAKTDKAHRELSRQFLEHEVEKKYLTLVVGKCQTPYGRINMPVGRSSSDRKKMKVSGQHGRAAVSFFKVIEEFKNFSLLEVMPKTGRTHQIRVHLAFIGHPVMGDKEYGQSARKYNFEVKRQMLHAHSLKFVHPTGKKVVEFTVPIPADMKKIIESLRVQSKDSR
jgi:23S rRNA pseudouridine1911/1915/1917 synthase